MLCARDAPAMSPIDVSAILNFFFDPSIGCCCCIPIVGFIGTIAGIAHAKKNNLLLFKTRASTSTQLSR
jgi:hypothetical protein